MFLFLSFYLLIILEVCSSLSQGIFLKTGLRKILRLRTMSLSSTNIPIEPLQSIPHPYYGLLSGLPDATMANYYSMNLPLIEAAELVRNNRQLYEIIEKECESDLGEINKRLEEIYKGMNEFIAKKEVWDRKSLLRGLDDIACTPGNFACLLGGKSTGKSLVLTNFSKRKIDNRIIFYIDLRKYPGGIVQGLVDVLSQSNTEILKNIAKKALQVFAPIFSINLTDDLKLNGKAIWDILLKDENQDTALKTLLETIISFCPFDIITLVLDEANLPLTINDRTSEAKIEQVKTTLSLFTTLTKQEDKVNNYFLRWYLVLE